MNTAATSQIFCGARFATTMRRDWRMERSAWGVRFLAMFGVLVLFALGTSWFVHQVATPSEPPYSSSIYADGVEKIGLGFVCYFFLSIFTSLGASLFHSGYGTPGQRLNELMNPASTLERFTSRFIICIIGVTVAYGVCWELADWVRVLVMHLFDRPAAAHVGFFEAIGIVSSKTGYITVLIICGVVCSQACYALGSTIWPKLSFLKTFAAMFVIQFIYGMAVGYMMGYCVGAHIGKGDVASAPQINISDFSAIILCSSVAVILFCFITAYFRMREDEIIDRM